MKRLIIVSSVIAGLSSGLAEASTRWDMAGCNPVSSYNSATNTTTYSSNSCTPSALAAGEVSLANVAAYTAHVSGMAAQTAIRDAYVGAWDLRNSSGVYYKYATSNNTTNTAERFRDVGVVASSTEGGNATGESYSPQHSMDNNTYYDSLLLTFSSAVNLNEVQLGWRNGTGGDTDISLLAYNGQGAPVVTGGDYASLLNKGWQLVGNYADVWTDPYNSITKSESKNKVTVNSANLTSSYWLVAAYNTTFGTVNSNTRGGTLGAGNDYVKLLAVYGSKAPETPPGNQVPEPSSALLLSVGLFGLAAFRRRRALD